MYLIDFLFFNQEEQEILGKEKWILILSLPLRHLSCVGCFKYSRTLWHCSSKSMVLGQNSKIWGILAPKISESPSFAPLWMQLLGQNSLCWWRDTGKARAKFCDIKITCSLPKKTPFFYLIDLIFIIFNIIAKEKE